MENLNKSYGVHLAVEVKTDTRPFDMVEGAAARASIRPEAMPEKPTPGKAISRAITCLMRICAASIEFPAWSQCASWVEERAVHRMVKGQQVQTGTRQVTMSGRNPNYSLKVTLVKQAHVDAGTTWRINIANRNKAGESMGHVLSVTYSPLVGLYFTNGTDAQAFDTFGKEIKAIVETEYQRFLSNYNDEDIRGLLSAELADMKALKVIKKNNCFIPHVSVDRAKALYEFAKECGQEVSWLGLDASEMTRDSLLHDLKSSIFSDMDEYEEVLNAKLNTPTGERKRGEKQRERMFDTAIGNIDRIMALAEYHADVLGVMAEGIRERRDALRSKAHELLTKDFDAAPLPAAHEAAPAPVVNPDEVF